MLVVLLLAPEMHLTRKPFAVSKGKRILSTRGHGEVRDQVKYEEAAGGILQRDLGSLAESFIPQGKRTLSSGGHPWGPPPPPPQH